MARRKINKRPGGSNAGKYPKVKSFAGPSGGAPSGSYPINTIERGRSALKLAHNAPNPSGIKQAVYRKYPSLKKQKGGPLKQLNNMQFARRGKAVGSMLEGGRIMYNEGGPYEPFTIDDVQRPAMDAKGNRHSPYTTTELVDDIDLRNTKQYIKNARFAKGTIKRRISDGMLLKGSPEHKALKKIFKEERKKGSYKRSNYFYHPKNR